jgi:aminoglycoside phosphotransferase (APT) family kinase protein
LGSEYVIRLPRIDGATENINKECEWVPKLSPVLGIPISKPVFKGSPDKSYPWFWSVTTWNEGQNPNFEKENEYKMLAKDLACFLNELHGIKGPVANRR